MKKRLLAIILCAVMIVTALPVMVMPAAATTPDPATCTHASAVWSKSDQSGDAWSSGTEYKKMTCSECSTTVIFEPWDETAALPTATGNYYLTADLTAQDTGLKNLNINLDLNGKTITAGARGNNSKWGTFALEENSVVSVFDSSVDGTGKIKAVEAPAIRAVRLQNSAKFNLYGGTITGFNNSGADGGAMWAKDNGAFAIYGGTVTHSVGKDGKAICLTGSSTLTMYGGVVIGINGNYNVVNVANAHVYDDTCTDTACNVVGCTAEARTVSHEYDGDDDYYCNVCNKLRAEHTHPFVWTYVDSQGAEWVEGTSEGTKYKKVTCTCGIEETFSPWDPTSGTDLPADSKVYMTKSGTTAGQAVKDDGTPMDRFQVPITIDLNGYTLSAVDEKRIAAATSVTIYDSVGTGRVVGSGGNQEPFVLYGPLTVYGGTIDTRGLGLYNVGASGTNVPVLYGGTFTCDCSSMVADNFTAYEINDGTYKVVHESAGGVVAAAVRVGSDADSSGIQFKAIFNDSGLTDKGTATANFGVLVISKAKYDALATKDYASIAGVTGVINAKGTTGIQGEGVYTMLVTINDIAPENYDDELVALRYVDGAIVGDATVRSVKSVAEMALADPACEEAIKPILNAFVGN